MQLSRRLRAAADMVGSGRILGDIGTDHGYIPIYLIETGRIRRAIAADVNRGPLERARTHVMEHGLEGKIELRLSDGLLAFSPGEIQSVLIAGMGGALAVRILREGEAVLDRCTELILQPQSEIRTVRAYLEKSGWRITKEEFVCEDGKYYPMMKAIPQEPGLKEPMSEMELEFGPYLLHVRHPELLAYLLHERTAQHRILESLRRGSAASSIRRRKEILQKLDLIEEALRLFDPETGAAGQEGPEGSQNE